MKYWCKKQLKQNNNLKHKTMKKSLLITAIVLALSGGAFAQTVLPLLPASHGMTGNQPAYSAQQQQEFPAMATGWNWWSSYIDLSDDGLGMLETMLGSNASAIKSQTQFTLYSPSGWEGSLNSISNEYMYMIQMSNTPAEYMSLTANQVTINDVNITAQAGWTWVGFPSSTPISVADAMTNYSPNSEDVVKGISGFAIYDNGNWEGSLTTLVPGQGYMIKNNGLNPQTFHYGPASRHTIDETPLTKLEPSIHDFPNNMSMIAVINLEGEELHSSNYEVAAFSGNVCRGAVIPQYVESINRYVAFLSISGEDPCSLSFRLLDYETGNTYIADNNYTYQTDVVEGNFEEPYKLNFNTILGANELSESRLILFPNPAKSGQLVRMSIPGNNEDLKVQIINTIGMIVKTFNMNSGETSFSANMAPGIYTVKIVNSDKQLYVEKLIVE